MRLLIVGTLKGQLSLATKIAMDRGASVTNAESIDQALAVMRAKGADLVMIDVVLPVRDLILAFEAERIRTPVVACGTGTDSRAAVAAIQAGAREYIPLPPDPELIAAVLEAVSRDSRAFVYRDDAMAARRQARRADRPLRSLDPDHGRERHGQGGHRPLRAPAQSTARTSPSSPSTARPSRTTCWNPSCSATRRAPSPARSRGASASSRRRAAARCCSTRSPRWTSACRPSCCARSRSA